MQHNSDTTAAHAMSRATIEGFPVKADQLTAMHEYKERGTRITLNGAAACGRMASPASVPTRRAQTAAPSGASLRRERSLPTEQQLSHGAETGEVLAAEMAAFRLQSFLKGRREYLGLRQIQVADRLGISERAYGNWERGHVREWTDEKLYALAEALEMSEYQTTRLFLYAVARAPQPDLRARFHRSEAEVASASAFVGDYGVMMDALSLPTFVIDRQWNVKMANKAYRDLFGQVRPHPSAMPTANFLRFGLFHRDAPAVLVDHLNWQLAMLAQLSFSLERHNEDAGLQAIRRDVYAHPALRDAYINDMPSWALGSGADLLHHEDTVRELRHPDPEIGPQGCRLVEETPRALQALGQTRLTLVLVAPDAGMRTGKASHDPHAA
ncbi:helix-turn-helix domain-containing protein [Streptomyces sp. NPDC004549]|uniref:MmyB family transcriptional regulator n=1 Tax=Streptomyces sp. NPDC004549 TaxID=3154283 RepID=UPI0033B1C2CA